MNIFCFVNETLEKYLRMGLVASGAKHVIRELELSVPSPKPPGKGERLEAEFNSHWPMMRSIVPMQMGPPKTPKGWGLGSFWVGEHIHVSTPWE